MKSTEEYRDYNYPMRRIIPAAIIRGMAAITCAKNSFREFKAGA